MEGLVLFLDSSELSNKFKKYFQGTDLKYFSVEKNLYFDLGNVGIPAISYNGKFYSGEKGLEKFDEDILEDLFCI